MPGVTSLNVSGQMIDERELAREIASYVRSERALIAFVEGPDEIDPSVPSLLPGWSIGHVMTHIARNADGMLSMLAGNPQYPHGLDGRNADIEAGAGRAWPELVVDVASRGEQVIAAVTECADWTGQVQMISGERQKMQVPILRQREVEVHRADLGLGYAFTDMPTDYVRRDLRLMGMLWKARKPMGLTPVPDGALAVDPATRLAWMMGRATIDGVDPAGLF